MRVLAVASLPGVFQNLDMLDGRSASVVLHQSFWGKPRLRLPWLGSSQREVATLARGAEAGVHGGVRGQVEVRVWPARPPNDAHPLETSESVPLPCPLAMTTLLRDPAQPKNARADRRTVGVLSR
jgi:hypothetical protein